MARAKNSADEHIKSTVIGYNTVTEFSNTMVARKSGYEYALLPVFMVNVKYKDKFYLFAMNGQTGEFIGNMPISLKKSTICAIVTFLVTFVLVILVSYIRYMMVGV